MAKNTGDRVRAWLDERKRAGRDSSQDWLAEKLRISPAYLSLILSGQRTPSLKVAKRLEELTGIAAVDFAGAA